MSGEVPEEIRALREQIEGLDRRLIGLLAERLRRVEELGHAKGRLGMGVEDAERESTLRALHARLARLEGLDPGVVRRVFSAVLSASKALQSRGAPEAPPRQPGR